MPTTAIPGLALCNVAMTVAAVGLAAFEGVLWLRLRKRAHLWTMGIALTAAAYSALMGVHYCVSDPAVVVLLTKLEAASILGALLLMPLLCHEIVGRRLSLPVLLYVGVPAALAAVLLPTDWLVSTEVEIRQFGLLGSPFVRLVETPAMIALIGYGLVCTAMSISWIAMIEGSKREALVLGIAACAFGALSALDATFTALGLVHPANPVEYGFVAMAGVLVGYDAYRYIGLQNQGAIERAVESASDALLVVDTSGVILRCNAALCDRVGAEEQALIGLHAADLVAPPDRLRVARLLAGRGVPDEGIEVRLIDRDGAFLATGASTVRINDGSKVAVALFFRDLRAARSRTTQKIGDGRTATLGVVGAALGHQVNNPLSFAILNVAEVRDGLPVGGELRPKLDDALAGLERIATVVRSVARFSRRQDTIEPVDVAQAVDVAVALTRNEVEHRAHFEVHVDPGLFVLAVETRLSEVLIDLLLNAVQGIEEGHRDQHRVRVEVRQRRDQTVFSVSDTGADLDEWARARAFDTPAGDQRRMGLKICRERAASMGGVLTVHSGSGQGATYRFALPTSAAPSAPLQPVVVTTRPRVLIVDDEELLLIAYGRILQSVADVFTASSKNDALDILRAEPIDVVLSDLMMPGGGGHELYGQIEELYPHLTTRCAFVTGGVFSDSALAFEEGTQCPVLQKPVRPDQLVALVDELMGRSDASSGRGDGSDATARG